MGMLANILKKSLCLSSMMLVTVASAVDVPDGGSLTVTDEVVASAEKSGIVCQGAATLTLALTKAQGLYQVKCPVQAVSGTVTIDLAACSDAPVIFSRDFRAVGSGRVVFTGGTTVLFGGVAPADVTENVLLPARYGFAALEGPSGFSVTFTNSALLAVSMPTGVSWSVAPNANLFVAPANGLAPILGSSDSISLTDFDVCMMGVDVFPPTATVTVPAGRTLAVKPMTFNVDAWSISTISNPEVRQKIVLADATSTLMSRGTARTRFCGEISGPGRFRVYEDLGGTCEIRCSCTFTGPVVLDAPQKFTLELVSAEALAGGNEVRIFAPNVLEIRSSQTLGSVFGDSAEAAIQLYANGSVHLEGLSGIVKVGKIADAVTGASAAISGASAGSVLWHDAGFGVSVSDAIAAPRVDITRTNGDGATTYHCFGEGAAGLLPVWGASDTLDVRVHSGADVDLPIEKNDVSLAVAAGGTAKLARPTVDIAEEAYLWLDASAAGSVIAETNNLGVVVESAPGKPYVQEWLDCRGDRAAPYLLNYRCYNQSGFSTEKINWVDVPVTQPILGSVTLNGLPVMDFSDKNRRIITANAAGYAGLSTKFCVMVFDSSAGGGKAMLATKTSSLSRGSETDISKYSADMCITTNRGVRAWLNGAKVADPTATGFSGGWDIVSFTTDGHSINGLGFGGKSFSDGAGGVRYAEIIFFTRELSDAERQSVEAYLAKKWALTAKYAPDALGGGVRLSGSGALEVSGEIPVSGGFGGTIQLAEGARIACGTNLPPDEAAIAKIAGRVRWMDPDVAGTVTFSAREGRTSEVTSIADRSAPGSFPVLIGNGLTQVYPNSIRAPWLNRAARGIGPVRGWLDYANVYQYETGEDEKGGNYLKFSNDGKDAGATSISVRSAFIVSDSSRGGGTPLLDTTTGDLIKYRNAGDKASDPIWPAGTDAKVTGGTTYLNGQAVDGTVSGFTGGPELFAFTTTDTIGLSNLGSFHTTEQTFGRQVGELLGESIFFDRVLGDDERHQVETYLMWKWLGVLQPGYDNLAAATIVGAGEVSSESIAGLPRQRTGFKGTLRITGDTLDFSYDKSQAAITDAFVAPTATLALEGEVTVNVRVTGGRLKSGTYTLVDAGAIAGSPTFHLNVLGVSAENAGLASLSVEGGRLILTVKAPGMLLLFR